MWFDGDLSFDNEYRYFYDRGVARGWRFKETFLDGDNADRIAHEFRARRFGDPVDAVLRDHRCGCQGRAGVWSDMSRPTDSRSRTLRRSPTVRPSTDFSRCVIAYATRTGLSVAQGISPVPRGRWLGTPLLFYMYVAPGFSHACSAFAVAAFVVCGCTCGDDWSLGRRRRSRRPGGVDGNGARAGSVHRNRSGPRLSRDVRDERMKAERFKQTMMARAVVGIVTFAVCFLPQMVAYRILFGRFGPSSDCRAENDMDLSECVARARVAGKRLVLLDAAGPARLLGLVLLALGTSQVRSCVSAPGSASCVL